MAKKPKKMWVFAPTKTVPTVSDQFKSELNSLSLDNLECLKNVKIFMGKARRDVKP